MKNRGRWRRTRRWRGGKKRKRMVMQRINEGDEEEVEKGYEEKREGGRIRRRRGGNKEMTQKMR